MNNYNFLQTTNPDIFAVGDCLPGPKFTHNSDVHARMVVRNALFEDKKDKSTIVLPKCTYTDPEVASVGLNEKEMKKEKRKRKRIVEKTKLLTDGELVRELAARAKARAKAKAAA